MRKRKITYHGREFESIKELAAHYGLSAQRISERLNDGWPVEKAVETGIGELVTNAMPVTYENRTYKSVMQMAEALDLPYSSLIYYVDKLKDIDKAIEQCRLTNSKSPLILWGNRYDSLVEIAMSFGISYASLVKQLGDNKPLHEAVRHLLSIEPIQFESRQYPTISELCMAYRMQPVNVYKRLSQGMLFDRALKQPIKIISKGSTVTYDAIVYPSKIALCREYGISVLCVNQNARLNKTSFLETFQILRQLKELAGLTKSEQLNFIPRCIIRGTLYKTLGILAKELGTSPELIKAYKRRHGFTNLFDALKAMQMERKEVCKIDGTVVTWEELKQRGYTASQINSLKLSQEIIVPVYPQLEGKDFDTDCIDTLEIYDRLRDQAQNKSEEQGAKKIVKEDENMKAPYTPGEQNGSVEAKSQKDKHLMDSCLRGLSRYAAGLACLYRKNFVPKVGELGKLIDEMARYWKLPNEKEISKYFNRVVSDGQRGADLPFRGVGKDEATVKGLYRYAMELTASQGRESKEHIAEIKDLMLEIGQNWDCEARKLDFMKNNITKELVRMEIPENKSITFSFITLSSDYGTKVSDFVPGLVQDIDDVRSTDVYKKYIEDNPDVEYVEVNANGYYFGNGKGEVPSEQALELIRSIGEDFLGNEEVEVYNRNYIAVRNMDYGPKMQM